MDEATKMKGIILAAGIGERMRPLTDNTPKPMLVINNRPVLEYIIALFRESGITDLAITTYYLKEKISSHFQSGRKFGVNIHYLDEHELVPSARALKQMLNFIDDEVLIINGDNITDLNLKEFIKSHKMSGSDITVASYLRTPTDSPSSQLFFNDSLNVTRYSKKLTEEEMQSIAPENRWANMGIYIMKKKVIESITDDSTDDIGDMLQKFLSSGFKMNVHKLEDKFYFREIGKIERFNQAKEEIESGKIKLNLSLEAPLPVENVVPEHLRALKKLELGSGERPTPGYLHQDITKMPGVELDFTCNPWEIPLSENSLSEVIALGLMEHLRFKEVHLTLKHIHKILAEGGSFLFDVPDMKVWSEYLYNLTHGLQVKNPFRPEHIWSTMYGWQRWPGDEHKSGWTHETMIEAIKQAGFSKIEQGHQVFTSKGIERGRFSRYGDAHVFIRAIK